MSTFEERAAQNEALFRSVNEEIEKLGRVALDTKEHRAAFVCECSDGACTVQVELSASEYEEVRSESRWFVVSPGHVTSEIEHVVKTTERYAIVAKDTPQAVEIVETSDPRD
jgi:hypothetical protein